MKARLTVLLIPIYLCSIGLLFAEKPNYIYNTELSSSARFTIEVPKEEYQNLLDKLPVATIEADQEKIIELLISRIDAYASEVPKEKQQELAEKLYKKQIEPLLPPRIEKFNSMMNKDLKGKEVSAGYLLFPGLVKGISDSEYASGISIHGIFHYNKADYKNGKWEWTTNIEGRKDYTRNFNASIDETIQIDLEPFGFGSSFEFVISCLGTVELSYAYQEAYAIFEDPRGSAETKVRVTPKMTVTANKAISDSYLFKINGEASKSVTKDFQYPATLEFPFTATVDSK